ncbi:23242_t:CDS:2, partial [Dentiscutata erythropus]
NQEIQKEGSNSISLAEVEESKIIKADVNIEVNIKATEGNMNIKNNNNNVKKMISTIYLQFTEKYRRIPKENKWTLSTEKVVKDALYSFGMKYIYE